MTKDKLQKAIQLLKQAWGCIDYWDHNGSLSKQIKTFTKECETILTEEYIGITYPAILGKRPIRSIWKKFMCPKNIHIFDEVLSDHHYLICDACNFKVDITG